jgi:hypothetical protein
MLLLFPVFIIMLMYCGYSTMGCLWVLTWLGLNYQIAFMISLLAPVGIPTLILVIIDQLYWKRAEQDYD